MSTITTSKKTTIIKSDNVRSFSYNSPNIYNQQTLKVYVNSTKLEQNEQTSLSPVNGCFVIYIDADFSINTVNVTIDQDILTYTAKKSELFERFERVGNMMDDDTSFMLLRVNPKLTGNVKVVVDSNGNMYMDTFKVSNGLSQQKYRKIPINPNEYYGRTLMAKFRDMPINDFYKIEESCYDLFTPSNSLDDQYYDKYNCGVRTNDDKMYDENFSILAPLCIKKNLPDFFLIIKVKNYEDHLRNSLDRFELTDPTFFMDSSNCEIVKCFDMRDGTDIGTYTRNMYENHKNFVGYAYSGEDESRMNIFNGISVERGVVTKIYESGYNQSLVTNQVALNEYFTGGFERNHIVSKDIINFEFMFDDPSEKLFSLNHYYGLYVRLNGDRETFSCIGTIDNDSEYRNIFDVSAGGYEFDPSQVPTMFYGISTPYGFERLTENVYSNKNIEKYKLKPHKNIVTLTTTDIEKYKDGNHFFASVQMNDVLDPGEHYRIIDKEDRKIYDVIVSNAYDENEFSDFSYDSSIYDDQEYKITRISILNTKYRKLVKERNKKAIIGNQARLVATAFNSFDTNGKIVAFSDENSVFSVVIKKRQQLSDDKMFIFEKVLSFCGYNTENFSRMLLDTDDENYYEDKSSCIFGLEGIEKTILFPDIFSPSLSIYFPKGFECLGPRFVQVVPFLQIHSKDEEIFPCLVDIDPTNTITRYNTVIYQMLYPTDERSYNPVKKLIRINYLITNEQTPTHKNSINCFAVLGFGYEKNYYMVFENHPLVRTDKTIQLYQNYPLNVGLCSIFQIKDIYNNVLDNNNQYMLSSGTDFVNVIGNISQTRGEYQGSNNVYSLQIAKFTEENFTNYVDKLNTYIPRYDYKLINDASFGYYLHNLIVNNHTKMDIAITVPNCCKWKTVGTDYVGNRLRLMYNLCSEEQDQDEPWRPTLIDGFDSYWIPKDSSAYIGLLSTDTQNNINKYIKSYNSFDDYETFSESIHTGTASIEDMLFYLTQQECRFSKVYEYDNDSIEFVSSGAKIRLKTTDKSKLNINKYVGYSSILVCMNGNNPRRPSTYELFIDETKEQIALFIFNGINAEFNILRQIPPSSNDYFEVKRSTSINKAIHNETDDTWDFIDDSFFNEQLWDFETNSFKNESYQNYKVFLLSIPQDIGSTEDSYIITSGNLVKFKKRNDPDDDNIYMNVSNVISYKNGTLISTDDAVNFFNTVDMYIVTDSQDDATNSPIRTKTLTLDEAKEFLKNYSVFVKTGERSLEYDESDNILQIRFVDPFNTQRKQDSSIYSTSGLTHPSYIVPLSTNILPFTCFDESIEYASNSFERCLNAANLSFETKLKVESLQQTWLRKVIDLDAIMMGSDVSIGYYHEKIKVLYYITISAEAIPSNPFDLTVPSHCTDLYGNGFNLIEIQAIGESTPLYRTHILNNELVTNDITSYEWSAYDPFDESTTQNATFDGSICTPYLVQNNNWYNGYIDIPNEAIIAGGPIQDLDQFRIVCTIYISQVHGNTEPEALQGLSPSTRFFAYDTNDDLLQDYGSTEQTAPFFDGYDRQTKEIRLRMILDASSYNNSISYILPINITPQDPDVEQKKIYINPKYTIIIPYPYGRSNLVHFTVHPLEIIDLYDQYTFVFEGDTPDTPMPDENNNVYNDEFKIYTTDRISEEIYDDSSTKIITYINTTGLTLFRNLNPTIPYWYTKMCRLFNKYDNYIDYYGAFSGYEKNMFLASRAITLKSMDQDTGYIETYITIESWSNTKINPTERTVRLDITESLIDLINASSGYSESWIRMTSLLNEDNGIDVNYMTFKKKYIYNTILKFIVVNEKTPFDLYIDHSSTSFGFESSAPTSIENYTKDKNISNKLSLENGRYYMTISNMEKKRYYAKMKIKIIEQ